MQRTRQGAGLEGIVQVWRKRLKQQDLGADFDKFIKFFNVLIVKTNAARGALSANLACVVGAVH